MRLWGAGRSATPEAAAVVHEAEDGDLRRLTFAELDDQVARVRAGLRARGIGKGDAVALFLPMTPEAVIATYAMASIGAIVVPLFSGFAPAAIASRIQDADAVAVIVADGTTRRRRTAVMKPLLDEALKSCPRVESSSWSTTSAGPQRSRRAVTSSGPSCWRRTRTRRSRRPRRRTCCYSPTRPGRPAGRRAPCTRMPASSSRWPARWRTASTWRPAGRSAGSPTWAGSWGRCRSSARTPAAPPCCSTKAPRTSRTPAGSGTSSSGIACRCSASRRR